MQSMVNVKCRYITLFHCIFFIIYVAYLFFDNYSQNIDWSRDFGLAKAELSKKENFNALLLGGSNVAYSLSAKQLSESTNAQWFNFGLSSEAFTDDNYWNYIERVLSSEKRAKIDMIVYSSVAPLRIGYIKSRQKENRNAWGYRPLGIIPNIALASRLKKIVQSDKSFYYPTPLDFGDFNFNEINCPQAYMTRFEREMNFSLLENWLHSQAKNIKRLFPNSKTLIVVPSEFYGNLYNAQIAERYAKSLLDIITRIDMNVFFQTPFPTKGLTCDGRHHGNFDGRKVRTNELSDWYNANMH